MNRLTLSIATLSMALSASAWSSLGHQVTTYIAKRHLTPEAAAVIDRVLDGSSPVYYASWLDQVKSDPKYSYTSTWHYINTDPGQTIATRTSRGLPDTLDMLPEIFDKLSDPEATDEELAFAVKVVVHIVGDLHQPLHTAHSYDLGGNSVKVTFMGKSTNLHSVWDYSIVAEAHRGWSYYDWQKTIDNISPEEERIIICGDEDAELTAADFSSGWLFNEWGAQTVAVAESVFDYFPAYCSITSADVEKWTPTVEMQLLRGGLRLAAVLNTAFSAASGISAPEYDTPTRPEVLYYNLQGTCLGSDRSALQPGFYLTSDGRKLLIR